MFDQFLKGMAAFNPQGSLSGADANRIWDSYKAAGGGGPVKIFGRMGGPSGPQAGPVKFGLPQGGILGLLQGTPPQGLIGMLQRGIGGSPLAGNMPQAGMNPMQTGMPGNQFAGPPAPGLPMNIDPTNQF